MQKNEFLFNAPEIQSTEKLLKTLQNMSVHHRASILLYNTEENKRSKYKCLKTLTVRKVKNPIVSLVCDIL